MRHSRVLKKLRNGELVNCFNVHFDPQANRERFVILQIEDPEPIPDLDAIAALEGIDMLFFGPADFSQGIGAPGNWDHPRLIEARERVAEAALKNHKFAGTTGTVDTINELEIQLFESPAVVHIKKNGHLVSPLFHETVSTVNREICRHTPFGCQVVEYQYENGAYHLHFFKT